MFNQFYKSFSMLIAVFGLSLALTTNCYALNLTSGTSSYSWKTLANGNDFVCQTDDGEMAIDASINLDETVSFVMESPIDTVFGSPTNGQRISHTCCEVEHNSGLSVADCAVDSAADGCGACGEFILDQKVEDYFTDSDGDQDPVPSNCTKVDPPGGLEAGVGGLETYSCQVSNGSPKETWVWHLLPVDPLTNPLCDSTTCDGDCGVAMGTTDNAKPGDYPYGDVWRYKQYVDPLGEILLAEFEGNWCHTGSFCLDDDIKCSVKKLDLLTNSTAEFIVVEVDTVNSFNFSNTNGTTPTDFFSAVIEGELVDATIIDTASITINGTSVTVSSPTSDDHNDDGLPDLRTHISTEDYQRALGACNPEQEEATNVLFKGTFTDGRGWIGEATVNVICN